MNYRNFINSAIDSDTVALDLGCGNGEYSVFGDENFGGNVLVGLDIDEDLLRQNAGLKFRVLADAHRLPFRRDVFDLIICREVVEHIKEPKTMFSEASRILNLGGTMVIITPNKLHPLSFLSITLSLRTRAFLKRIFTHEDKIEGNYITYYKCNTGRKLHRILYKNGLSIERLIYGNIGLAWIKSPIIKVAFKIYQKITDIGILRCFKQHITCLARKTDC